jgi:hypothetical protein
LSFFGRFLSIQSGYISLKAFLPWSQPVAVCLAQELE